MGYFGGRKKNTGRLGGVVIAGRICGRVEGRVRPLSIMGPVGTNL